MTEVKEQIKISTLQNKWAEFVIDNKQEIRLEVFCDEQDEKYDKAWYFATDLFLDELSKEYNSEMLKKRFEEVIFNDYCSHFMDELFMVLDDCFGETENGRMRNL